MRGGSPALEARGLYPRAGAVRVTGGGRPPPELFARMSAHGLAKHRGLWYNKQNTDGAFHALLFYQL